MADSLTIAADEDAGHAWKRATRLRFILPQGAGGRLLDTGLRFLLTLESCSMRWNRSACVWLGQPCWSYLLLQW